MSIAIVWFRRDLRVTDHPALQAAAERHPQILPVYIHAPDEEGAWADGGASRWWLHHSLAALDRALRQLGTGLLIRRGASLDTLQALIRATGARAVYWNRRYEPAVTDRDTAIKTALREAGIETGSFNGSLLEEPWQAQTRNGGPFKVFTPFWRQSEARLRAALAQGRLALPPPRRLQGVAPLPRSEPLAALALLPKIRWDTGIAERWTPGENGATALLERFCEQAVGAYRERRDHPGEAATSRLSPHLHFGEISPLQIVQRLERAKAEVGAGLAAGADHYVRELGWREFSFHLLYHFPQSPEAPLNPRFAEFPWRAAGDYAGDLRAWQCGRTGIPIVDAGMRELWHSGWMHNRVRMIVASFLTKNLLIPWQEGARWFWDTLVDADLANNTQGWQWTAGCGADAAPYFRVFNPILQSRKFDADGAYLRRWLPELAGLPDTHVHAPWQAPREVLDAVGLTLGKEYPLPLVDLQDSRSRALNAYHRPDA